MNLVMVFLSCIIDIYLLHLFFSNYFDKREVISINRVKERGVQVVAVAILYLCNFIGNGDWNAVITPILLILYVIIFFKGRTIKKILYLFTSFCILYGCEFLFMIINSPRATEYKNSTYTMLTMLLIKFLSYICILFTNQIVGKRKKVQHTNMIFLYMMMPIASLFVMAIVFYSGITLVATQSMCWLIVVSFIVLFLGNIVTFYAFERYSEQMYETMKQNVVIVKQKKDLEYYMQVSEIDQKQKEMIHDISNHMKMIHRFAKEKNTDAILDLTNSISDKMEKDSLPILCDNTILNSVINEKNEEAKQKGIMTDIYVEPGVMLDHVLAVDLISMIGNLLDNAIRAAAETDAAHYIKVFIYMKELGGFCVIKVLNSYKAVNCKGNGEFETTKNDDGIHGIGLQSINRTAEKYGGYLTCTAKDNVFESVLLISTDEG